MKNDLKFYLRPPKSRHRGGSDNLLNVFLISSFLYGWKQTNKKHYGVMDMPATFYDGLIKPQLNDFIAIYAHKTSCSMAEYAYGQSSFLFNNETHPCETIEDIEASDRLLDNYYFWKEYMIGVKDWEDIKYCIKQDETI